MRNFLLGQKGQSLSHPLLIQAQIGFLVRKIDDFLLTLFQWLGQSILRENSDFFMILFDM